MLLFSISASKESARKTFSKVPLSRHFANLNKRFPAKTFTRSEIDKTEILPFFCITLNFKENIDNLSDKIYNIINKW